MILVRLVDIARMLSVSKQRAHQVAIEEGFPAPVEFDPRGRLWDCTEIERWAEREWFGSRPWRKKPRKKQRSFSG
jgi:hypothetical protein